VVRGLIRAIEVASLIAAGALLVANAAHVFADPFIDVVSAFRRTVTK
jgi:hypothetical protein